MNLARDQGAEKERPDLRLVIPALAAWAAAWCALGIRPRGAVIGAGLLGAVGLVVLIPRFRGWQRTGRVVVAAALLCAATAGLSAAFRISALHRGPLIDLASQGARVTAELVITTDPERREPRTSGSSSRPGLVLMRGRAESISVGGQRFSARHPVLIVASEDEAWLTRIPSERVRVTGRLAVARPGQPIAAVLSARGSPHVLRGPSVVQRVADRLRRGLRQAISGLPPEQRGLLAGLVVGDIRDMPEELTADFRTAGLTHLTAVSGANVAIVLTVVLFAVRWVGLRGRLIPLTGVCALAGFAVLARPQPSVLRATVMGLIAVITLASGQSRRRLSALCAAVLALVLVDPWLARSYGFMLSVLATGGLLVFVPRWRDALTRRGLPRPVAEVLIVSLAAQIVCAPVVVMLSGRLSLIAIPANLLASLAVAPATILGMITAVTAVISMPAAHMLSWLAGVPTWWIVTVAQYAARLPGAAVPWPASVAGAVALTAVMALLVCCGPRLFRVCRRHVLVVAVGLALLVVVAIRPGFPPSWPPRGWILVACDVGQGDAVVLAAGEGTGVVVDTGPDPVTVDRCLRDLGIRRIPLVLLTHFHADHVDGLPGVLRSRAVAEVQVGPLAEPAAQARRVAHWTSARGVPLTSAAVGERRQTGGLSWQVLWPIRIIRDQGSAPNNASVVLRAEYHGIQILLTGDIEPAAQRALLRTTPVGRIDVLKVPHHGSAYQDPELFRALAPRLALISVGQGNPYGHPAPATEAVLRASGARVMRTDRNGAIAVLGAPDQLRVVTKRTALVGRESPP